MGTYIAVSNPFGYPASASSFFAASTSRGIGGIGLVVGLHRRDMRVIARHAQAAQRDLHDVLVSSPSRMALRTRGSSNGFAVALMRSTAVSAVGT